MGVIELVKDDFRFYRALRPRESFLEVMLDRYFLVCANYRFGHWACQLRTPFIGKLMRFFYMLTNGIVSTRNGTDIRPGAVIGRRFEVHTSFGITIDNGVVIGDDCIINTGVCLANKANGRGEGVPKVGNKVIFGLGCKVFGGITVGDNVIIGANAVVSRDVPSGQVPWEFQRKIPVASSEEIQDSPRSSEQTS
jgi:serine O-acetyltransferase